jgi:hypothetical protein
MPYGVILDSTRDYVMQRAVQARSSRTGWVWTIGGPATKTTGLPENLYQFTVILDWVLDEQCYAATDHALTIADWTADRCREESARHQAERWRSSCPATAQTTTARCTSTSATRRIAARTAGGPAGRPGAASRPTADPHRPTPALQACGPGTRSDARVPAADRDPAPATRSRRPADEHRCASLGRRQPGTPLDRPSWKRRPVEPN